MRATTMPCMNWPARSFSASVANQFTSTGPTFMIDQAASEASSRQPSASLISASAASGPRSSRGRCTAQGDGHGEQAGRRRSATPNQPAVFTPTTTQTTTAQEPDQPVGPQVDAVALEVARARHAAAGQVARQRTGQAERHADQQQHLVVESWSTVRRAVAIRMTRTARPRPTPTVAARRSTGAPP